METNRFFFKLTAIFLQYILMVMVFIPIIYVAQLLKYKFETENIEPLRVLFFSIALAMPFVVANAFSFAKFDLINLECYLKSRQIHGVLTDKSPEAVLSDATRNLELLPFWKVVHTGKDSVTFRVRNLILTDETSLTAQPGENGKTRVTLTSRPVFFLIFLDFGRNYRNILTMLKSFQTS